MSRVVYPKGGGPDVRRSRLKFSVTLSIEGTEWKETRKLRANVTDDLRYTVNDIKECLRDLDVVSMLSNIDFEKLTEEWFRNHGLLCVGVHPWEDHVTPKGWKRPKLEDNSGGGEHRVRQCKTGGNQWYCTCNTGRVFIDPVDAVNHLKEHGIEDTPHEQRTN